MLSAQVLGGRGWFPNSEIEVLTHVTICLMPEKKLKDCHFNMLMGVFPAHMSVYYKHVWCPRMQNGVVVSLELKTIVSHH